LIGNTYRVQTEKGMIDAVLFQATVADTEKLAYYIMGMPDGSQGVVPTAV